MDFDLNDGLLLEESGGEEFVVYLFMLRKLILVGNLVGLSLVMVLMGLRMGGEIMSLVVLWFFGFGNNSNNFGGVLYFFFFGRFLDLGFLVVVVYLFFNVSVGVGFFLVLVLVGGGVSGDIFVIGGLGFMFFVVVYFGLEWIIFGGLYGFFYLMFGNFFGFLLLVNFFLVMLIFMFGDMFNLLLFLVMLNF